MLNARIIDEFCLKTRYSQKYSKACMILSVRGVSFLIRVTTERASFYSVWNSFVLLGAASGGKGLLAEPPVMSATSGIWSGIWSGICLSENDRL